MVGIPTNIADAAASIRDGSIVPQEVKIGDVVVSALTGARITQRKEVTRRPVQAGYSVDVGVIDTPTEIEMDIVLANPDYSPEGLVTAALTGSPEQLTETWTEKRDALYATMESKEIIDVTTHDQGFSSFVIESIDPVYDANEDWEGWIGTVRLVSFGNQGGDAEVSLADAATAALAAVGGM
jgi:hypothetical protein